MERVIIIPALNPDERLKEIINTNWDLENLVIVVDDGSGKEYQRIFQEISGKCIVLRHEKNRGKGAAIKTGLDYIEKEVWDCRIIGTMDADGQHCAEDMDRLMTKAAGHSDTLILGARRMDKTAPWRSRIGNFITRIVFSALTGKKVRDTQTGLRAFSRTLLEFMIQVPGERYEYETNVLIACVKKKIPILEEEVPAIYHDRKNSGSHFRKIKDSFRIYAEGLQSFPPRPFLKYRQAVYAQAQTAQVFCSCISTIPSAPSMSRMISPTDGTVMRPDRGFLMLMTGVVIEASA